MRSARVVAARKLLRRAVRRSEGAFLADGPQAVREALRFHSPNGGIGADHPVYGDVGAKPTGGPAGRGGVVQVREVYVDAEHAERHADLLALADRAGVRVLPCEPKAIASLSEAVTPQGIVARCAVLDVPLDRVCAGAPRLLAVPVDVRDPGNLGTIIRCADASGADGVAILGDSVDLYNSKTVRATAGSIFHLPIAFEHDAAAAIGALRAAGLQVIATEGEASTDLDDFIDAGGLAAPTAWLFGNEAHGLADEVAALADVRLRIPIRGMAESLNLSTAAAICLFASARAHR